MTFRRAGQHDVIQFDASPELAANVQRFFVERAMGATCRAQALIEEGRQSIKEIAQELGFSDMSSFSQAYKRWTGVAPSVSRQEAAGS
ncbi:AraC family transcriptional regulator [Burkholderia lata]|uniref:helix-turn-helix domain-containing protein n=1 Tax=Burkholderia lata (strain ATCC 17760 / DSM 23089 / LMG 22485 / NCIMB 9086 / R18194 / 383) TaxID=482957 RepID=UPI0014543BD7|nr:helix-turn-helix domain-containing protein [Burkholderia lata]VWC99833.1 AraC family transcriptional regulator [Burkholderia lata]